MFSKNAAMVFCNRNCSERKKCSSDREKLLIIEAEGREFAKILRSLEQFLVTECFFLICSWGFLIFNELKKSKFKL